MNSVVWKKYLKKFLMSMRTSSSHNYEGKEYKLTHTGACMRSPLYGLNLYLQKKRKNHAVLYR